VLRGYIDSVTSLGYVEGWAYDTDEPAKTLEVALLLGNTEVAWGLAHRFRADLMEAAFGVGWCAFRLRLGVFIEQFIKGPVRLIERPSATEICVSANILQVEDVEALAPSIESLALADPTVLAGIWQLKRCEPLFMDFIARRGIDAFLSIAYAYVLGRPIDGEALSHYTRAIRQATLSPFAILEILEKSDEFQARPKAMAAPSSEVFPFAC